MTVDEQRIGDQERDGVTAALGRHVAAGRLTLEEYEQRLDSVYAARTPSELAPVLRDLPALPEPVPGRLARSRQAVPAELVRWMLLSVVLVSVWALAGFGFPWPIFPILATAQKAVGGRAGRHGCGPGWGCGSARGHREAAPEA